jgi:hypothetical protein
MTDYTHCGTCALGTIYSHDFSYLMVVVAESGEVLGAGEVDDFTRFWFIDEKAGLLIDGDTAIVYEVS